MSQNLIQKIVQMIDGHHGKISFYDYMQSVLYDSNEGYYTAHISPMGQKGDFTTAPELSPLFGQCIVQSFLPVLKNLNNPVIIEMGGGTGSLAKSVLAYLTELNISIQQYIIVDISPPLKKIQQEKLKKHAHQIRWVSSLDEIKNISGIIIANEFFDALPAKKFCYQSDEKKLWEYFVKKNYPNDREEIFDWCLEVADQTMEKKLSFLPSLELPQIYHSEYHPDIPRFIQQFSSVLDAGCALIIDYGYPRVELYHPQRDKGTLRCFFKHQSNDNPFLNLGFQDITAHVDFTSIAASAFDSSFEISGFTSQAAFLLSLKIAEIAESYEDKQAIKLLTLPQEMGEIIKVLAITKNTDAHPLGFELQDRIEML